MNLRLARFVIPGQPQHVIQRGNNRQEIFRAEDGYHFYFDNERWDRIWQRFEEKGEALSHDDLRELFPDEPALIPRTG